MPSPAPVSRIRALFARAEDPYAGADMAMASRLGAVLWIVSAVVVLALLPLSPPDEAIGETGWAIAGATVLGALAGARLIRKGLVSWNQLLVTSYVSVVQIGALVWLAGGTGTPYAELYLLVALYAGALHPPRRVAGVVAALLVAHAAPLAYEGLTAERLGQATLRWVLLCAVAFLASGVIRSVRAQRLALRDRGEQAERLARIDELTTLPNRRALGEALATEIARSRRFAAPLSVVIADLDGFKQINDAHGHPAGDAALRAVADALRGTLRQYDSCFRWGGDEFVLLLPQTTSADAETVCRRATAAVAGCPSPTGGSLRVTCAPAQLAEGMEAEELLAAADAELLARKLAPSLRLAASA